MAEASELFHETDSTAWPGVWYYFPVAVPPFSLVNSGLPDRPGTVQGAKRQSGPLTARTYLESLEARERGERPVDKINHLGRFSIHPRQTR